MKFTLVSCLVLGLVVTTKSQTVPLPVESEAIVRGGLPHFFSKIKENKKVKVAYLGGSITRADKGWRDQTFEWIQKQYPSVGFEQIMAAIGGTGSDFGAHRLQKHVLQYRPDLVFVEFAVNDNSKPANEIKEAMEGIVRQIWKQSPKIDICFVYTFSKPQLEFYQAGNFPVSASAMEQVADYYQIPSICMALPAVRLITEGKMLLQGKPKEQLDKMIFSEDGVHPFSETGQKVYAETVGRYLKQWETTTTPQKHKLKTPMMPHNLENAKLLSLDKINKSKGWKRVDTSAIGRGFASMFAPIYASGDSSDFLAFSFNGTSVGLVDIIGPSSGQVVVWIDQDAPRYINRFDEYCTYNRLSYTLINGLKAGTHKVTMKVSPNKLDKATILQKRNNKISDPALYEKQFLYIGAILEK